MNSRFGEHGFVHFSCGSSRVRALQGLEMDETKIWLLI